MNVYVVIGEIYYDGDYFEGVFSNIDKAKQYAESLKDYDSVSIHEAKIDDPEYGSDKWRITL